MLVAITERRMMGPDPIQRIADLMRELGPHVAVQIREKDLSARTLHAWCAALIPVARDTGARLFVNTRADLARCFHPHLGLHLPEDGLPIADARALLGPDVPISAAVHARDRPGADLALISPVFPTPSKAGPWLGLEGFVARAAEVHARGAKAIALGGVDASNAGALLDAGADGVAAIRAVWEARPPLSSVLAARIRARNTPLGTGPT